MRQNRRGTCIAGRRRESLARRGESERRSRKGSADLTTQLAGNGSVNQTRAQPIAGGSSKDVDAGGFQSPDSKLSQRYVPELDGVRGIAIAGVMFMHFVGGVTPTSPAERAVAKISGYGDWGVDLFFVLSGFLITGILIETKSSSRYLWNFYVRRALRIFPLYYGTLLVLFVLIPSSVLGWFDPELLVARHLQRWMWPYLTNVYLGSETNWSIPYVSHFWTLAVEEHFYLFWPFLILFLTRRAAMRSCVLLGLFSLALRIAFSMTSPTRLYAEVLTPCRLDALCAGAWFAMSARGPYAPSHRQAMRWLGVGAASIIALSLWHRVLHQGEALILPLRTTVLAAFFGVFIYLVSRDSGLSLVRAGLRANWLRNLGKYSYGLYVYHGIVSYALRRHSPEVFLSQAIGVHAVAAGLQIAFGSTVSLLLAVASYELFESRFLVLKKRFDSAGSSPASREVEERRLAQSSEPRPLESGS